MIIESGKSFTHFSDDCHGGTGWFSHLWLPFVPLVVSSMSTPFIFHIFWGCPNYNTLVIMPAQIILLVGTKLQVIITKMGLTTIQARGEVVRGNPVVQPGDDLFWFNRPRFLLYLIHFVFFQVWMVIVVITFYGKWFFLVL